MLFFLFKANSFSTKLLQNSPFELFAPKNLIAELKKYSDVICSKAGISKEIFSENLDLLPELIMLKEVSPYFIEKAKAIIKHESDVYFFALALELNIPLWSNDAHFKEQNLVKVFTTEELKEFIDNFS